jgi:hypothetical protein
MIRDTSPAKFAVISRKVSLASLADISAGYCQIALVDGSGIIRTQMGTHNRSEVVAVLGTPCAIPPVTVTVMQHLVEKDCYACLTLISCTLDFFGW